MRSRADTSQRAGPLASLAIDNLRAIVILLVVAFHSALAYLNFLPHHPFAFEQPPYLWRSFPIVDNERWIGFDLFCAWLDVFLMSFFFMLSGLFAWPSLRRKGAAAFLQDRVLRLGLPFAVVVLVLMPVAHYPSYLQSEGSADPGIIAYWRHWLDLPFWPSGPMWFLWLLLIGDLIAVLLFQLLGRRRELMLLLSSYARQHPGRFFVGFALVAAFAYVPLALWFGPSDWVQRGPFSFQLSRPLHYALYLLTGVVIGACGIERGLAAADGPLARRWRGWLIAAALSFAAWIGLTGWTMQAGAAAPFWLRLADDLSFAAACFSSCYFAFAVALRFGRARWRVFDSLAGNAYGIYLIHYLFIVWLQYALLGPRLPAIGKWVVVCGGTLALSWSMSAILRRLPSIAHVIGGGRRRPAAATAAAATPSPGRREGLAR